jgi:hypothetical protein
MREKEGLLVAKGLGFGYPLFQTRNLKHNT